MDYKVIPAILRYTKKEYVKDLKAAEFFADYMQIDIVGPAFSDKLTVAHDVIASHPPKIPVELDLMVGNPKEELARYIELPFVEKLIFHIEKAKDPQSLIDTIHSHRKRCGVAISPDTDISVLEGLRDIDALQCMTIVPGAQGKLFRTDVLEKIERARGKYSNIPIAVDGGITNQTLPVTKQAGANLFVSGSYIFWSGNPAKSYRELVSLV